MNNVVNTANMYHTRLDLAVMFYWIRQKAGWDINYPYWILSFTFQLLRENAEIYPSLGRGVSYYILSN